MSCIRRPASAWLPLSWNGSITVSPDREPGARRIGEIRERLKQLGSVCVFAEPQFQPRLVEVLVTDTGARAGTLDPEGGLLPAGPELYFEMMRALARNMAKCLSG